ncbi:putative iron-sulfur cluster-binding protein, partial [Aspergillus homomorphus CBS 101889]
LLVALALLYQTLPRPFLQGYFDHSAKQTKLLPPQPLSEHEEPITISKEPDFPTDWWTSSSTFELERRAIFSKHWLCVSHRRQFSKPGDYHTSTVVGLPIFLILGKDGDLRAFHNVCRHRAYPVIRKDRGSSTVLGCRYHGWSYNSLGQLIKAPHFDGVVGFDRAQNGLFAVHTFTSQAGFVFVNLDARQTVWPPEVEFLDGFAGPRGLGLQSRWVGGQTIEGEVNWKMCLRVKRVMNGEMLGSGGLQHKRRSWLLDRLGLSRKSSEEVDIFPITTVRVMRDAAYWYTLTCIPVSAQRTSFRLDLYSCGATNVSETQSVSRKVNNELQRAIVELEADYRSCPNDIRSSSDYDLTDVQLAVLDMLKAHLKLERQQGTEVFPAMRKPRRNARFEQAEQLCKHLDCVDDLTRQKISW